MKHEFNTVIRRENKRVALQAAATAASSLPPTVELDVAGQVMDLADQFLEWLEYEPEEDEDGDGVVEPHEVSPTPDQV